MSIREIVDLSAEIWVVIDSIVSLDFDDVSITKVYERFNDYVNRGVTCTLDEVAVVPFSHKITMPPGTEYVHTWSVYMFEDVDTMFSSLLHLLSVSGDFHRANMLAKCLNKMRTKIELDALDVDKMGINV
jgi:hypothetical protein